MEQNLEGIVPLFGFNYDTVIPEDKSFWRAGHTTNIGNIDGLTKLLIFGGYNSPNDLFVLNNAHKIGTYSQYDEDLIWERVKLKAIKGRSGHFSFIRNHGGSEKLYIFGGYNDNSEVFSDLFTVNLDNYQTESVTYDNGAPVDLDRRWCAGIYDSNEDRLWVHGGWNRTGPLQDLHCFHFDTKEWHTHVIEGQPSARRWHSLTPVPHTNNSQLLMYGGYNGDTAKLLKDMYVLDISTQKWVALPTISVKAPSFGRCRHSTIFLNEQNPSANKQVVILGGYRERGNDPCREIHIFHLDDYSWSTMKPGAFVPILRAGHQAINMQHSNGLLVVGGVVEDYVDPFYYMDMRMLTS